MSESLASLASNGLRGELVFPVPLILEANPRLLGYYRLLYGFSQKEFYTAATGVARFHSMEKADAPTKTNKGELAALCAAIAPAGHALLEGIGANRLSRELLDDLTLLTSGPQLREARTSRRARSELVKVFDAIHEIVNSAVTKAVPARIQIKNAAGRTELIVVEVKGGSDLRLIPLRPGLANAVTSAASADKNEERTWQLPRLHHARLPDFARRLSATLPG